MQWIAVEVREVWCSCLSRLIKKISCGAIMGSEMDDVAKHIVITNDDFRIVYYKQSVKPKRLVVTFDPHGHGVRDKGFGSDLIIREGYDHIFVSHRLDSQYQDLSLSTFSELVTPLVEDFEVYTYGASVGGYCAIYYGGCINARAIAFSPRNSAHPSVGDRKFSNVNFRHSDIRNTTISTHSPIVIYDPVQDLDRDFVRNYILPAYPCTRLVSMPYAGHLIAEALLELGLLKDFVLRIINEDKIDYIDFRNFESSYWAAELAYEHIRLNDIPSAATLLKRSLLKKHNSLHLDTLMSLTRIHKLPFSILYDVIDPYMILLEECEYFDADWYLQNNPDLAVDGGFINQPTLHYLLFGGYEGRDPSPQFSSRFYLDSYPDIKAVGANPLLHYIRFGKAEGRQPLP